MTPRDFLPLRFHRDSAEAGQVAAAVVAHHVAADLDAADAEDAGAAQLVRQEPLQRLVARADLLRLRVVRIRRLDVRLEEAVQRPLLHGRIRGRADAARELVRAVRPSRRAAGKLEPLERAVALARVHQPVRGRFEPRAEARRVVRHLPNPLKFSAPPRKNGSPRRGVEYPPRAARRQWCARWNAARERARAPAWRLGW